MGKNRPAESITRDGIGEYVDHPSPLVCRRCGIPMMAVWCRRVRKERDSTGYRKDGQVAFRRLAREYPVGLKCEACDIWIDADVERETAMAEAKRREKGVSRESQGLNPA